MNKLIIILLVLISFAVSVNAQQSLNTNQKQQIQKIIDCLRQDNVDELKSMLAYPIKRQDPLKAVIDADDFVVRYSELFDDNLKKMITTSDMETDWSLLGAKGIMFENGLLWLDTDGRIIALNYESDKEKMKRLLLIGKSKETVHESIRNFGKPVYFITTKKFKVRIDQLKNGSYRYASWSSGIDMTHKPDLVLYNGKITFDGSGGNHAYRFKNGIYTYEVYVYEIGEGASAELNVYKNNERIVNQPSLNEQ
ncbi:MAG: hypothetical protein N4A71_21320 [Carboxylicivirga sp.]|nr:hypothetical protein [Carboxylicivirga sp.]